LLARSVNVDGPDNLATAGVKFGIPLIHVSTDYVFDGQKNGAYREDDPIAPLGIYGQSKAEGDDKVRNILSRHVIVRTAWFYGVHGHNFVKTILRLAKERETLRIVDDQRGCPTFAGDLASALLTVAKQIESGRTDAWGTYHYCGAGETTWYGFARKIIDLAGSHLTLKAKNIIPITTAEYPTPARRPANSVLDCSKFRRTFGVNQAPWPDSLARMLDEWLASPEASA
ncbi:MAG: dTDP-4-dehydrorhamnose reductase, partial [Deltaproteobacteria bacterium]|nr:dTDP-4-dehydrorhamnose reductase [Deltaproteobacteria bacterium]